MCRRVVLLERTNHDGYPAAAGRLLDLLDTRLGVCLYVGRSAPGLARCPREVDEITLLTFESYQTPKRERESGSGGCVAQWLPLAVFSWS